MGARRAGDAAARFAVPNGTRHPGGGPLACDTVRDQESSLHVVKASIALFLLALAGGAPSFAAEPPAAPRVLETVVVSGVQPGPGLWKVSRGDHVLWVLGTLQPLPKRMTWEPREVVAKIESAQEVLLPGGAQIAVSGGPLRAMLL